MLGISIFGESGFGYMATTDVSLPCTEQKAPDICVFGTF